MTGTTLSGTPPTIATTGQAYAFRPTVTTSATQPFTFSIKHLPFWAKFNPTTGQISGTPNENELGPYTAITISLIEGGVATAALPPFTITVALPGATNRNAPSNGSNSGSNGSSNTSSSNTVSLSWQAPTENSDGTPLTNLQGYTLHYGTVSQDYTQSIQLTNPGLTTYVVQNLPSGTYYFAITAYNTAGSQSGYSPEVSTVVD